MRFGKACNRIKQKQHVLPLVTEVFCSRHRAIGGALLGAGRFAGRGRHDHGFGQDRFRQNVANKVVHFAAAFADEGNHNPVGFHAGCK